MCSLSRARDRGRSEGAVAEREGERGDRYLMEGAQLFLPAMGLLFGCRTIISFLAEERSYEQSRESS